MTYFRRDARYGDTPDLVYTITDPGTEPVTIDEFKLHLRWGDDSSLDDVMEESLKTARQHVEVFTRRQLMQATVTVYLDEFPYGEQSIELPVPPLSSVTSVTYVDTNGTSQTLSTDVYQSDTDFEPGRIYLKYNQVWPDTRTQRKAVTIVQVSGYSSAANVPATFKSAIKLLAADLFENACGQTDKPLNINATLTRLLWGVRVVEV